MASSKKTDFGGARGSNTGDDFHEFWAMRQALRLIERGSKLSAMALEGLTADAGTGSEWDGVDCTLLYGGEQETTADRVELQQLKYSAANSSASWTVSRISAAKTAKPESSVIGKMAVELIRGPKPYTELENVFAAEKAKLVRAEVQVVCEMHEGLLNYPLRLSGADFNSERDGTGSRAKDNRYQRKRKLAASLEKRRRRLAYFQKWRA